MYLLPAAQQTSTVKMPVFFWRFQTEERALRVNKSKVTAKILLMEIILRLKVTMNQIKTKKFCFGYLCRFVTRDLTLRP